MRRINKATVFFMLAILIILIPPIKVLAVEAYGYEVSITPSPVAIGSEVTLTLRLTDYSEAKSGVRGFQIDITDVDDILHQAVCTSLVTDTENLFSNTAKYQSSDDCVRHLYGKMSGTMSYEDSNLLEVRFVVPETYTAAGILLLPLKFLIRNEDGDNLTYRDTIKIRYAPASEIPSVPDEPDPDVVSVDVTWGAMEFEYVKGTWNTKTHSYENAGWTDNGSGYVTLKNAGTSATTAEFSYITDRTDITGSLTNGSSAITSPVDVAVGEEKTVYLTLSGKPAESLNSTKLGTVSVRIGGE